MQRNARPASLRLWHEPARDLCVLGPNLFCNRLTLSRFFRLRVAADCLMSCPRCRLLRISLLFVTPAAGSVCLLLTPSAWAARSLPPNDASASSTMSDSGASLFLSQRIIRGDIGHPFRGLILGGKSSRKKHMWDSR